MKRERLFRILGLIDDGLIEEASSVFTSAPPHPHTTFHRAQQVPTGLTVNA